MNKGNENKGEKTDHQETFENKGKNTEVKEPKPRRTIAHQGMIINVKVSNTDWWHMLARS